ncbi:MAG TPA: efflux RND transporter periplasmic adaptor subunit [Acetobacteraceae bacterium]|nr:efflux RND transporter periplasmic adaptor subunit [Acetobacteraceae bacterium]
MNWRRIGFVGLMMAAGVLAGWHTLARSGNARAAEAVAQPRIPVTATTTRMRDVPVYLDGLGTVQAYNIDEIKAQVNGILIAVPVREGQEVHKGDVIAEIDPTPYKAALDQAIAQRAEDTAQLLSARLDLRRFQDLAKRSFAPIQQVDDQQATVDKFAAAVQLDNAAIVTAQFNLNNCTIRAPIDGRVSLYQTDIGNLIEVGSQTSGIVSLTQDKPIAVVFTLPESELGQVQTALAHGKVPVLAANSQDASKLLGTGTLLTPDNTISTASGTISLKAAFDNPRDHLWPGQFVDTRVQVTTLHDAVTLPTVAVQHGPDGLFVYVVQPDQTVAQQAVQVGYQDDGFSVVTKGLSANQTVVLSGQSRLAPGTHVAATMQPATLAAGSSGGSPG